MTTTIAERLALAQQRIIQAAQLSNREPSDIKLLAVSKTKPLSDIEAAIEAGQRCFGENYVQEGVAKIEALQPLHPELEWHFIGPLQSNKSRLVAAHFDWLHTLDSARLASRLSAQRPITMGELNVLIQVNISQEDSKSGVEPADISALAEHICSLPGLRLRGLMTIPSATEDKIKAQNELSAMKALFDALKQQLGSRALIDTLSMGMSDDLELAIASGSTMVRIGSAIFGARHYGAAETSDGPQTQ